MKSTVKIEKSNRWRHAHLHRPLQTPTLGSMEELSFHLMTVMNLECTGIIKTINVASKEWLDQPLWKVKLRPVFKWKVWLTIWRVVPIIWLYGHMELLDRCWENDSTNKLLERQSFARTDKLTYLTATATLKEKMDPSRKTLASQDFYHLVQGRNEAVVDFIMRLEQAFQWAYGLDYIGEETCYTLLHIWPAVRGV